MNSQNGNEKLDSKLNTLRRILNGMGSAVVAYSGGVDSTFLLKVAHDALGSGIIAVTALSETYTANEKEIAIRISSSMGVEHILIPTHELEDPLFANNPPERCFYCKRELFTRLATIARCRNIPYILDGTNSDDLSDYRPGRKAAAAFGVRSPLAEAGLGKDEIRILSRRAGLPTWDNPCSPCLASRFPYGEKITSERLQRVHKAEMILRDLGFRQVRVRSHGTMARIEVEPDQIPTLADPKIRRIVAQGLVSLGFQFVSADLEGYRMGSLNRSLPLPNPNEQTTLQQQEG